MSLKMGHVGSKTRSLDQILEKRCSLMLYHTVWKAQVSDFRAIMALLLTLSVLEPNKVVFADSVDQDQTAHNYAV